MGWRPSAARPAGHWVQLPAVPGDWIDVHGTIGVLLWPVALLLARSMLKLTVRDSDRPRHWPKQLLKRR